jgi:hypothetical protein
MLNVTVARNVHWTISVWHVFLDSTISTLCRAIKIPTAENMIILFESLVHQLLEDLSLLKLESELLFLKVGGTSAETVYIHTIQLQYGSL